MAKPKQRTNSIFQQRSSLLTAFLLVVFVIVIGKLFYLQVVRHSEILSQADAQHKIYKQLLPSRGQIELADDSSSLDSFPVAANLKSYLVYAVPQDVVNPNLTASALSTVLQMDAKDILVKVTDTTKKYIPIKKHLTDDEQGKIKALGLPGIYFDSEDTRFYPANNLLSQVVGFVGYKNDSSQKIGLYGLEKYFQDDLAGSAGGLSSQTDNLGTQVFGVNSSGQLAKDGVSLILTVDKAIQFEAQSVIQDAVQKNGADQGSIIVADPKTGKILAMANYPDFDPNQFNKVTDPSVFNNLAVTGNYEPGSTFKAITMAAALDEGKVTPDTTYTDYGFIDADGFKIKNAEPGARGVQTMGQVIDFSLNTGAIFAETQLGNSNFLKYIQAFGFGKKTGIELPETWGNLDGLKGNIKVNYYTASFGQGITVTPLQLLQAYGALANGGLMMKPYIVASKIYADGTAKNTQPKELGQVISRQTDNQITAMLVDDVENGFGKKAGVPGYYLAGKTGTSQVAELKSKGYQQGVNIGSFAGYGPVENPKFVMVVRVDHPRDVAFAESTAAPAWGKMAQFLVNYMQLAPTRPLAPSK